MNAPKPSVVVGVFKGMGDLLCAVPVILSELQRNNAVHLLLFPNTTLHEFCGLIDFSPYGHKLHIHSVPLSANFLQWKQFLAEMRGVDPEFVWISPHAPAPDSSWKIPLLMRSVQLSLWRGAKVVGADTERLARVFNKRLEVDRKLPLLLREWSAYRLLRGDSIPLRPPKVSFLPAITDRRRSPLYDLVIHPGASAENRMWPLERYGHLVSALPDHWKIVFVGLPGDLRTLKKTMPASRPVEYVTGTIRTSLETLASARSLLVMDSGNMHFAQVLGVPAIAMFGSNPPSDVIELDGCVEGMYWRRFPCQPCRRATCSQPEIYCLNSLEPDGVADRLKAQWERLQGHMSTSIDMVHIENT